ncbi:NACHT domain-containing NTPase [Actinomadura sp. NEAU-AAG7]|uniref:NACHT domain-containing protein n=1 Tax=Actinomadura sp. NEAU-AAG7 TaxID=2839640 RepID=UPI001BE3EB28|nr:NACHT domain-containing protein [Actinomadura sp. NEAU-AAG7]MBT2210033.1 NACHT domain-containing protein [Actinomadura sp. NEAU-AAG7]
MSVEVAALRIGGSVAQVAAGRWMASRSTRDAAGRDLVELIKTGFPDEIKRRRVHRQFEGIADAVAERLLTFAGHEFPGLTDGDRDAALHEVTRTIEAADLSDDAFFAADADPVKLARSLRSRLSTREAELELGEAGARLYEIVLDECCDCLARILIHLPQFGARASVETLDRLTGLSDQISAVLSRLPARSLTAPEGETHDEEFTRRYLASISENLDTLELFGVRFERFTRPQTTLSVAYISLNVSDDNAPRRPHRPHAVPVSDWREDDDVGGVRVEQALGKNRLMLVRGEAGGGKSTLLRWLAITAARGAFTGPLTGWNGSVPFVIKLRSHAGGPLPRPEEFLDDVAGNLVGIMPRGWAHRRLLSGRALLFVDGVDEVAEAQRQAVRAWLRQLIAEFPRIQVVVTSRPAAAGSDWLRTEGFATAFLEQLGPSDVRALVHHWHGAVRGCSELPCAPDRLPGYEARLLGRLEAAPHLRTLASNPLLAAMLCALNLDRDSLPRNRMALYAATLNMLLDIRDAKRGIPSPLEREEKIRILQGLAWHLSTSGRVELPKTTVEGLVADRLAQIPRLRLPAHDVLDSLLQRSGVIREPVPGRVDFVHRTVQEYLAAKQAADLGDMDLLIRNAHLDAWRETVVMAAGHANEPLRRELISGILDRAASEPRRARTLRLVAASCLETLPSVPDDLRADLDRCLDSLTPPRSIAAARSLAAIGEPALTRLPQTLAGVSEPAARAAIHLARLVNGPAALDVLSRYGSDPRSMVQYELDQAWKYFDPEEYAVRVLAAAPPTAARWVDLSPAMAKALQLLPPLTYLTVQTHEQADFSYLGHHAQSVEHLAHYAGGAAPTPFRLACLPRLRALTLEQPGLPTLRFLDDLPELEQIWITECADITDFKSLKRQQNLHTLMLFGSQHLTDITMLPTLERLTALALSGSRLRCDLADVVPQAPDLEHLILEDCEWVRDLSPLAPLPLAHLRLALVEPVSNIDTLATLSALRTLHLSGNAVRDLSLLTGLRHLRTLYLRECPNVTDIARLSELPRLERLHIEKIGPGVDLEPLATNRKLVVTISPRQSMRGGAALGRRLKVLSE